MESLNGLTRIYCSHCCSPPIRVPVTSESEKLSINKDVLKLEADIILSLNDNSRQVPFKLFEDIAFLFLYLGLPQSLGYRKERLRRWDNSRIRGVSRSLLATSSVFDASLLYPLSTVVAHHRHRLIQAGIAIMQSRGDVTFTMPNNYTFDVSLNRLFRSLDGPGKEELILRAGTWPQHLLDQLEEVGNYRRA